MARKALVTWVASSKRWLKKYKGSTSGVSCRQLGCAESRDASLAAANVWWEQKQKELDTAPPSEEDLRANAFKVWSRVQDWGTLDEASRERLVDSLVGAGQYQKIKEQAEAMVAAAVQVLQPAPPRAGSTEVFSFRPTGQNAEYQPEAQTRETGNASLACASG